MCSTSESSNWMIKIWWFIRFQLWVFYLVFIAFVPLFSPAMWQKSRLLSSPDGLKTKHLKPQERLYGSWVDFSLQLSKRKQNFRFYETNVQNCEKIGIIKKSLLHFRSCILVVFRVNLIWVKCYISAVFFGSATFNMLNLFIFPFCVFYTLESYGFSIETWT